MTAEKKTSKTGPAKNDGKNDGPAATRIHKMTANKTKCEYQEKSKANGFLYCKKSPAGAYCVEEPGSKGSAFECPLKIKKYTLNRTNEDLQNLEKLRRCLQSELNMDFYNNFITDSAIYKKLPDLYMGSIKKITEQDLTIQQLTARVNELDRLRMHISSALEICNEDPPVKNNKTENKICFYFNEDSKECDTSNKKCNGKDINCEDYEAEE